MSNALPDRVRPLELARTGTRMEGELALQGMDRLAPSLARAGEQVQVWLHFGCDAQNVRYIRGRVTTTLELTCQRCLEAMLFPVDIAVSLGIIGAAAEAERLPGAYEPLLLDESESVSLKTVVEDELLLALPLVALHDPSECRATEVLRRLRPEEGAREGRRPFAGLAELLKTRI